MDSPDKFLNLTATGWTAIGSIVGALSIVILSFFNWKNLRAANDAVAAAQAQAKSAHDSLEELKQNSIQDHLAKREIAISVAREIARSARNWQVCLSKPDPGNDISILPKNWNSVRIYAALFQPERTADIANFIGHITAVETKLIQFLATPYNGRQIVGPAMAGINGELANLAIMADTLARQLNDGK